MANKKLQNNQNKKNTDGPTMNGNNTTATAASIHSVSQNSQHSSSASPNATHQNNNSAAATNGTTTPTPSSTTSASQHHQSQNQYSHPRPLTTSSSSQQSNNSKQPVKKVQHNEVEKILLQINSSVGSQSSHGGGGARGGGGGAVRQDLKAKEKEKEKTFQAHRGQSNQANHHHPHLHHNTSGGSSGNQQNHRKKENKFQNRDQSNQSHRGGGSFGNNHSHQYQSSHSAEIAKSTGFPSNSSLSSSGQTTNSAVQTFPPPVESKTVQTDEIVEKKEKVKVVIKEEPPHFKSTNPKDMDTVMAFKEHDDWNKVELLLELISFLSPTDLRLLGNCIEGSVRCYTNQMRPVENTSNGTDPTACLPAFLCSLTPQPPSSFPTATSENSLVNQRSMVNNLFTHQHPPGLPPLIPAMIYPVETNYQQSTSSSTAPPSTVPTSTKELCNGTTTTSSTTSASNTPSEIQQQDSQQNVAKVNGSISTSSQQPSKPLPEAEALSPTTPTSARTPSATTPQPEPPVPQEPEKFLKSVRDLTSYLYMLMSVCASTNRKSAAKISDYVKNVVIREKGQILERIPNELDKIDVLQDIGKIVAAMTHHPAVSVDDKMKYADMRDGLRAEIECLFRLYYSPEKVIERKRLEAASTQGVGDVGNEDDSDDEDIEDGIERRYEYTNNAQSSSGSFFITRFIGRPVEKKDDVFSLEIHWSDGDCTFAQRSSTQLKALQHRLLDEFGQQRSEKYHHHGMASSMSSFDEDHKKLSTSTSTMETSFAPSGERIVPRLARDATPLQYIQYINELSDLPARMMLSTVICEEFNGTRLQTKDLLQETNESSDGLIFSRWKNPRAKSPVRYFQRNAAGNIEAIELPINLQPFLYSNIPQTQMQTLFPSCSNCGGPHMVKDCGKPTLLDRKALVEHKMRLDPEGPVTMPPQIPGVTTPATNYTPMHAQMTHPMYIDNTQLLGVSHFNHHQQQQIMQQNALFHNGQYRPNGQFENPGQLIFYQQVVQNSNNTNGNNGNGGGSQNSNF